MPAHIPIALSLGLSLGVATAVYLNRDKIMQFIEEKKRELEVELQEWNEEYQRAFNPETSIPMSEQRPRQPLPQMRELRPRQPPPGYTLELTSNEETSAFSSLMNPFSDSNEIPFPNVAGSEIEQLLYDSILNQELRNRLASNNYTASDEEEDDLYHSVPSAQPQRSKVSNVVDSSADEDEEDDLYHSLSSNSLNPKSKENTERKSATDDFVESGFFSYVDVKDDEVESDTSTSGEVFTPTASEAGDYMLAKDYA